MCYSLPSLLRTGEDILNIESIVKQIRQEIERLGKVLHLLGGTTGSRKKRKLSAAGRKRIAAAQRARWAKIRAAKKK
jgi:hypothetical protein